MRPFGYTCRTAVASALLALGVTVAAADEPLGRFKDWSAIRFGTGAEVACMAFTQLTSSGGGDEQRRDAFVFVTHRPGQGQMNRVSVESGYTHRRGDRSSVRIDDLALELRTDGSSAWLESTNDDARLIDAMRAGLVMHVEGVSSAGARISDRYSLLGFSAAYDAITKACEGG